MNHPFRRQRYTTLEGILFISANPCAKSTERVSAATNAVNPSRILLRETVQAWRISIQHAEEPAPCTQIGRTISGAGTRCHRRYAPENAAHPAPPAPVALPPLCRIRRGRTECACRPSCPGMGQDAAYRRWRGREPTQLISGSASYSSADAFASVESGCEWSAKAAICCASRGYSAAFSRGKRISCGCASCAPSQDVEVGGEEVRAPCRDQAEGNGKWSGSTSSSSRWRTAPRLRCTPHRPPQAARSPG